MVGGINRSWRHIVRVGGSSRGSIADSIVDSIADSIADSMLLLGSAVVYIVVSDV